ncbi:unnamed protein product [Periconia digitata]|uniref:NACHT domain-containing protein n=1 Tax=Periconia digitata TaxID=1303443 RepID=A0A9W4UV67_9PLEO|nr:unnamed protein product [Periconia digitata]
MTVTGAGLSGGGGSRNDMQYLLTYLPRYLGRYKELLGKTMALDGSGRRQGQPDYWRQVDWPLGPNPCKQTLKLQLAMYWRGQMLRREGCQRLTGSHTTSGLRRRHQKPLHHPTSFRGHGHLFIAANMPQLITLALAIVQAIDFADKLLSKEHAIHRSTKGASPGSFAILNNISNNLYRLNARIVHGLSNRSSPDRKSTKVNEATLFKLAQQTKDFTTTLTDVVLQAQAKLNYEEPNYPTPRDALGTVMKEKEMTFMKKSLGTIRTEVDATLLLILRQSLDQSNEKGLASFDMDDHRTQHWGQWQNKAINSINTNGWTPKNKQHVEEFSKIVNSFIAAENEAHFRNEIFANLHFAEQDDRLHSINAPYDNTLQWILEPNYQKDTKMLEWLGATNGQNLFWLTGKPGSGKSTLMKYLFRNEHLFPKLEDWSGHTPGILAGFFIWNCGTTLQSTTTGLLRALLYETLQDIIYGPLEQDPDIVQNLFEDRWQQFKSYGAGLHPFSLPELRKSFDSLISDTSKKFFFMIDGLDELEENPSNALDLVLSASYRENVKICVSSRSTPVLERAFQDIARLEVDRWTRSGILSYVLYAFDQNDVMFGIPDEESDGTRERAIINTLVDKAGGTYLWASLGTELLIQTTKATDDVQTISDRVAALPPTLDALLPYIINSMDARALEQASRLFRLVDTHGYPSLLPLCFATDQDTKSGLNSEPQPLTMSEILSRTSVMRTQLKSTCKTLLSIFEAQAPEGSLIADATASDLVHFRVNYTHRCIKDFVQSEAPKQKIYAATGHDAFNTDEHWANAHLWSLKTVLTKGGKIKIWEALADCIEFALRLEASTKRVRLSYLDEVSATLDHYLFSNPISSLDLPCTHNVTISSFFDIAVWLNLSGYIRIKVKTADRKMIRHGSEFNKDMRKMLGTGGEEKWIRGRGKLREVYGRPDPELNALLKEFRKTMRITSPKITADMPEWV